VRLLFLFLVKALFYCPIFAEGTYLISSGCVAGVLKAYGNLDLLAIQTDLPNDVRDRYGLFEVQAKSAFQEVKNIFLKHIFPEDDQFNDSLEEFIKQLAYGSSKQLLQRHQDRMACIQTLFKEKKLYVKEWHIIRGYQQEHLSETCEVLAQVAMEHFIESVYQCSQESDSEFSYVPYFDILIDITSQKIIVKTLPTKFFNGDVFSDSIRQVGAAEDLRNRGFKFDEEDPWQHAKICDGRAVLMTVGLGVTLLFFGAAYEVLGSLM
jgi:hypothetical protein